MDSTICKYCNEPENKQYSPGLICDNCISFVHLKCLRKPGTPGDFTCDVFFDFTCEDCSKTKKEVLTRNKFPWVNVILLTLHHLNNQCYGISNHGFFHYKTHICSFIDRHWHLLFGARFKQKKNWVGTIAGALSVYNNLVFQSGSGLLGETGWWRLLHGFSPAVAAHIIQELARDKRNNKGKPRNHLALDKSLFIQKVTEMGYKDLINIEEDHIKEPVSKKRKVEELPSFANLEEDDISALEECVTEDVCTDDMLWGYEFIPAATMEPVPQPQSDSSSHHSTQQAHYYESDSRSGSPRFQLETSDLDDKTQLETQLEEKRESKRKDERSEFPRESLFSTELNSVDEPWLDPLPEPSADVVEMSQYAEIQLLKQVESLIKRVKDPNKKAHLYRLKAKLTLRRLKRHKHLPIFDLDKTVRILGGYVTGETKVAANIESVLDRFQRSYLLDNLCGTIPQPARGAVLTCARADCAWRSPHSGALLKPVIRVDRECRPLWLTVMDELLARTNGRPRTAAALQYAYVRPQHIPAVNALLAQHFWPRIDLTEALQYPEFSCVVTYKKLVVACAFLVPDAGPHEAYISFVLTRPEWRRAGIATFMLYHLLQTCTGKDVTLHVSPTNPAIFLYQKFGFKVEELIQDFYEKYFDIDYKGSRHALFLRLVR